MEFLKKNYSNIVKKTKQWYYPNENPTNLDKQAFDLLDKGKVEEFIELMETKQVNLNVIDFSKATLLMKAQGIPTYRNAQSKDISQEQLEDRAVKAINYLVKKGIDINFPNKNGMTALLSASHWGYEKIVETLLIHGADPNLGSNGPGFKTNPLLSSVFKGHKKVVQLLLIYGANPAYTQAINNDATGFKLSQEDLKQLYSAYNIYKLVHLRKIQSLKKQNTVLANCSQMMFDQICKAI